MGVINRLAQVIVQPCRTGVELQCDIDLEALSQNFFFRVDAMPPEKLHIANPNRVTAHRCLLGL
jgi:hypothetical protein